MSKTEAFILSFAMILVGLLFGVALYLIGDSTGYRNAYIKGMSDGKLYYETTGEYPSFDWVDDYKRLHFDTPEEILETLEPFDRDD